MNCTFNILRKLLKKPATDPGVAAFTSGGSNELERSANRAYVALKGLGISFAFIEAAWIDPQTAICRPRELYVRAIHLYREGHEGYKQYANRLPLGIYFGDSNQELLRKLGNPIASGGGKPSSILLGTAIPRWTKYAFGEDALHLELDANGNLQMLTIQAPDYQWIK
jgi:hypothetical protein